MHSSMYPWWYTGGTAVDVWTPADDALIVGGDTVELKRRKGGVASRARFLDD